MNFPVINGDWRKIAAAAVQDDAEIEKAFLDQAFMTVQNKCAPLMKPPFRVGFEIVHKNDENTRMVGVFVFRIKTNYLYVPVFFVNGSIKGTDLLYRADVKRFVPLNNEWCTYLIQLNTTEEGQGISQRERQFTRDQMNLIDLVEPPEVFRFNRKYASTVCNSEEELATVKAGIDGMMEKCAAIPAFNEDSVLRKFITQHGGFNSIKKLSNTARHDFDFAQALMVDSHPDNYMPRLDPYPKQASTEHLLTLHTSVLKNGNVKKASPKEMSQGYKIEDFRKEAMANDVVYADNTSELATVEAPGVYNVLLADGGSRKMLVGYYLDMNVSGCPSPASPPAYTSSLYPGHYGDRRRDVVLIDSENRNSDRISPGDQQWPFGEYTGKVDESGMLTDMGEAEAGQSYRIYDMKTQSFSEPFYIKTKAKDPSGLTALFCHTYNTNETPDRPILVNPEYEDYDQKDNIFGKNCKLVRITSRLEDTTYDKGQRIVFDKQLGIGGKHTLNAFIFENNFKKASVISLPNDRYLVRTARRDKWSPELSKISAKIQLMVDCAVREDVAEDIIKSADTRAGKMDDDDLLLAEVNRDRSGGNLVKVASAKREEVGEDEWQEARKRLQIKRASASPQYSFLYDGTKLAHNLKFNDWPDFYERTNDEFGVLEQPWTNYILDAESDRPIIEQHRVGDKWTQDDNSAIDTMTPMQLHELSMQKGIGNLFEHGVVGELVKTYDSISLIQSYLPDLEKALDRIGRIVFLFYWKPEDFSKAYGSDDQSSMENKLLSNFKSLGEMILELLQKAKLQQEGSVSLT